MKRFCWRKIWRTIFIKVESFCLVSGKANDTVEYFKYLQRINLNMASGCDPGTVLQISIKKCDHSTEKNIFASIANRSSMLDIFERYHGHADLVEYDISIATETKKADNTTSMFEIQSGLTVADLISKFEIKNLVFYCKHKEATATVCQGVGQRDYNAGNKLNAFDKGPFHKLSYNLPNSKIYLQKLILYCYDSLYVIVFKNNAQVLRRSFW